jgi:hypothetical protein
MIAGTSSTARRWRCSVLQVRGIGGHSHHVGFAVDNIRELQLVTAGPLPGRAGRARADIYDG